MLDAQTLLIVSAGSETGRPCRRLAGSPLEHLPHDRVLDLVVRDVDPVERCADRDRAELGRLTAGEAAAQPAERRADGRDDHRAGHTRNLSPGQVGSRAMQHPSRIWAWSRRSERGGSLRAA
jgi:hypothetical protein